MCLGARSMQVRAVGAGAYSSVFADDTFAYKVLGRALGEGTHTVLREGLLLKQGYGVKLQGLLTDENNHITGFVLDKGICSLSAWRARRPVDVAQLQFWCQDLLNGMSSLHAANIIHGDIKPQNMIVFTDGSARLCDFGLSALITSAPGGIKSTDEICTMLYRPPELMLNGPWILEPSIDVWSFGVTLYEILFGKTPFNEGKHIDALAFLDVSVPEDYETRLAKFTKDLRICCCPEAVVFAEPMAKALSRNPSERPSAWALLQLIPKPTLHDTKIVLESRLPVQPLVSFKHTVVPLEITKVHQEAILTRALAINVAKLVQFPTEHIEAYVGACNSLFNVLHEHCGQSRGVRAVVACALCMFVFRTSDCLRVDWLAKMANTTTAVMNSQIETCLVTAILDPSWCEGIWCTFIAQLGPTYV